MAKDYSIWEDKDKINFEATITGISDEAIEAIDYDFSQMEEGGITWNDDSGIIELDVVGGDINDRMIVMFGTFKSDNTQYIKPNIIRIIKENLENLYDVDENMRIEVYIE